MSLIPERIDRDDRSKMQLATQNPNVSQNHRSVNWFCEEKNENSKLITKFNSITIWNFSQIEFSCWSIFSSSDPLVFKCFPTSFSLWTWTISKKEQFTFYSKRNYSNALIQLPIIWLHSINPQVCSQFEWRNFFSRFSQMKYKTLTLFKKKIWPPTLSVYEPSPKLRMSTHRLNIRYLYSSSKHGIFPYFAPA